MELLASRGCQVEYVTPERMVAPEMVSSNSPAYLRMMAEHALRLCLTI